MNELESRDTQYEDLLGLIAADRLTLRKALEAAIGKDGEHSIGGFGDERSNRAINAEKARMRRELARIMGERLGSE